MKTLLLVSSGLNRPEEDELFRLEEADKYPRVTLLNRTLNADMLDERFLHRRVPAERKFFYRFLPIFAAQILEAYIIRNQYDVVVCWAEQLGLPLSALMKVTHVEKPHVTIFSWISKPKKAEILRRVWTHIDKIILMSSVQRNFAMERLGVPAARIGALNWPVDQKFWRPMSHSGDMICTVGSEMRDFTTLIEAMRGLDIRCHIAAGTHVKKMSKSITALREADSLPPNLTVGKKSLLELRELYASSRFVIVPLLPTDTDNGTTSILEAMAMGKAVICSRVAGQVDVIRDGETGIFVPVGDPKALHDAIVYLWEHPVVAEQMGQIGRRVVEQEHTLDQWVQQVRRAAEDAAASHEH